MVSLSIDFRFVHVKNCSWYKQWIKINVYNTFYTLWTRKKWQPLCDINWHRLNFIICAKIVIWPINKPKTSKLKALPFRCSRNKRRQIINRMLFGAKCKQKAHEINMLRCMLNRIAKMISPPHSTRRKEKKKRKKPERWSQGP